ncbi:MAG: helicase associated domain-containing protein [Planctomycetes bacterium]|nr:helicase associated domain-containing protein [Planctomycetota bacterium]
MAKAKRKRSRRKTETPTPKDWDSRYKQLLEFIREFGRHPSRHTPESDEEESLAWWVKDQRRKLRYGKRGKAKRGTLSRSQKSRLDELGIAPDPRFANVPAPAADG